ncbi:YggS family pyridoxal phosphate-dependent enzyme [Aestuariivirga sp.]|uniref:YggS family pyridoxal phosphate-dependent enzyme n=1 Tax=Aestuariivirga sp. TaxID=2650926 RepID=UPI00391D7622
MVHEGLKRVLNGVVQAARAGGRGPEAVTLIAVSKTFEAPEIVPVIEAGQRVFGENRVQEAKAKWPSLRMRWPDIELHLIGPLQSNKAAEAVQLFDAIHTIDRPKIAEAVAREMRRQAKPLKLFVQVNTGREPQKAGIDPDQADAFLKECRETFGLEISGLMCIPPLEEDPKPHFALLAETARRNGLTQLSMGMSGDYPDAIAAGATHVRVGSAIFGSRG